jgi:hypothetical protein
MAFTGGKIDFVAIKQAGAGLATQAASSAASQYVGKVWKGAGQSFLGSAGQALAGNLAGSAVNIAVNSVLGTSVSGPQGLSLNSGANILASTLTPYVTSSVAAGINQNIEKSLKSAGPFGPALSGLATGFVNQATQGITNAIFGAAIPGGGSATNYKMFPGGGGEGEAPADYGGSAYTLTDVVFSLQRANQGPQSFGQAQEANQPKVATRVPAIDYTSMPPNAQNLAVNNIKAASIGEVQLDFEEGGYADPLGPLRGTQYDDLPMFTRDPLF